MERDDILEYRENIVTGSFKMSGEIGRRTQHTIHWGYRADGEDWGGLVGCGRRYALQGLGSLGLSVQALESDCLSANVGSSTDSLCGFSDLTFSYLNFLFFKMRIIKIRA